ncbi:MAG: PEP-CTERM sorting domain-containing protein [Opitutales bacterium]
MAGGQVVPEPSTYAAIAGVLALGLAVLRRRMRRR